MDQSYLQDTYVSSLSWVGILKQWLVAPYIWSWHMGRQLESFWSLGGFVSTSNIERNDWTSSKAQFTLVLACIQLWFGISEPDMALNEVSEIQGRPSSNCDRPRSLAMEEM